MSNKFLFFSAEAQSPTGKYLMNIYYPIETKFNEIYASKYANEELDDIAIIFICTDEQMHERGFYKERNYISRKNKYADMRLDIPYNEFKRADEKVRKQMMWEVIKRALDNIRRKKVFGRIDELEKDLFSVYWSQESD